MMPLNEDLTVKTPVNFGIEKICQRSSEGQVSSNPQLSWILKKKTANIFPRLGSVRMASYEIRVTSENACVGEDLFNQYMTLIRSYWRIGSMLSQAIKDHAAATFQQWYKHVLFFCKAGQQAS